MDTYLELNAHTLAGSYKQLANLPWSTCVEFRVRVYVPYIP